MKIHDCFLSFFREQESTAFGVVNKEVFGEDCGADGVAEVFAGGGGNDTILL